MSVSADSHGERARFDPPGARLSRPADRLVELGVAIAAITVTAQSVAHLVGVRLLDDRYRQLNSDEEFALAAWLGSSATFAAAFAVLVYALLQEELERRLLVLAGLLAFFSLDDAIVIHERLGEKVAGSLSYGETAERLVWPVLFLPLFALGLVLLLSAGRQLPARLERLVLVGVGLLALAVAAEAFSTGMYEFFGVEPESWPDALEVMIEEGAEVGAWILVATAFLAAVLLALDEDRPPERRRVAS
jgi:Na+/proline symporter